MNGIVSKVVYAVLGMFVVVAFITAAYAIQSHKEVKQAQQKVADRQATFITITSQKAPATADVPPKTLIALGKGACRDASGQYMNDKALSACAVDISKGSGGRLSVSDVDTVMRAARRTICLG